MFSYNHQVPLTYTQDALFSNRTASYLYPSIKFYESDLTRAILRTAPTAVAIEDVTYLNDTSHALFYTTNISNRHSIYVEALEEIKKSKYFIDEYYQDDPLGTYRTYILSLPEILNKNIITDFIEGKYSKLYTPKQVEYLIEPTTKIKDRIYKNPIYHILMKNQEHRKHFMLSLERDFKVKTKEIFDGTEDIELDYPPCRKSEILNYVFNN
jgi:hypothetical protein